LFSSNYFISFFREREINSLLLLHHKCNSTTNKKYRYFQCNLKVRLATLLFVWFKNIFLFIFFRNIFRQRKQSHKKAIVFFYFQLTFQSPLVGFGVSANGASAKPT
jgi:hypothetical protein